ncbi:MAG: DUF3368 domain-containing protein [Candidatus Micrarchaeota archaeon]
MAKAGRLDLLKKLFSRVFIPPAVHREVVVAGRGEGRPEVALVETALKEKWFALRHPRKKSGFNELGVGEAESIALAKELDAVLLIDDAVAKTVALANGVTAHGTLYLILRCVREKKISKDEATALLRNLVEAGFRISPEVYSLAYEAILRL